MADNMLAKLKEKFSNDDSGSSFRDSELGEKMGAWWDERSTQERLIVQIGLPLFLVILFCLLVLMPIIGTYSDQRTEYLEAQSTLEWLYDQAPVVDRLQNACGPRVYSMTGSDTPQTLLENIARRTSVKVTVAEQVNSGELQVTVPTARGNRLLTFVQVVACNGYEVSGLEITRSALTDSVSAAFVAAPISLPQQF